MQTTKMSLKSLTQSQIDYVLFHLKQHVEIPQSLEIKFLKEGMPVDVTTHAKIIFHLSDNELIEDVNVSFLGRRIPILFPSKTKRELFELDNNGNLVYHHDYLKSAFYILSGFQETKDFEPDQLGRFPYSQSIQKKLDIVTLPIVNYYFEIIISGLEAFCKLHSLPFKRKRLFENFGFFLSHDVDRIAFYHPREVAFKIKQLLGLAPLYYSKTTTAKLFVKGVLFLLNPFRKQDPWWNFDQLISMEKELNIRSSFYFLQREHTNLDSRYYFHDKKIAKLIAQLQLDGFEVGLHGTIKSSTDFDSLEKQLLELAMVCKEKPVGIRQHFLKMVYPSTIKNHVKAGLTYDATLGFAEHEGFRNGYCYPFRPFDFENDCMIDIWELPLTLMEVTVLNYRQLKLADLQLINDQLIDEVKRFGGFYSLLWHNCRLDEYQYPGVNKFYRQLLQNIMLKQPQVATGHQLVEMVESARKK